MVNCAFYEKETFAAMKAILFFTLLTTITLNSLGQTLLVPQGANWNYFDQGDVGTSTWKDTGFDDSNWASGNAELGYGDGDEVTVVSYGPNSGNKYTTTYFRKTINVVNPQQFSHLELNMVRDDGAVVYINGTEVWRSNMPGGAINYNTFADGVIAWPNEDDWHTHLISAGYLVNGNNTIAVEIHQDDNSSSDISFNFSMVAHSGLSAQVVRGPYLQKANQNSIIVRWKTDVPTDSRVRFGVSPVLMNNDASSLNFTTDHEVLVTGLNPSSTYYYSVGMLSNDLLQSGNMFFETLPEEGMEGDYRFVVLGDCGTGYQEQIDVKNAVVSGYGNHYDGVILLGDNAYQSGFDSDYQTNFFGNKYNEIFENTVIWPAPGNHDYNNHIPFSPDPAYYEIFNTPANGECGGVPSGTEKYYSFNYGNIHFISLDSYDEAREVTAAMGTWLAADLAANTLPWIVAYWHHPPYTKGSHDSDNDNFLDGELVEMREEIVPLLESYGVDLILNGHSHTYERSMFIDGHYGYSDAFNASNIINPESGDYPSSCPYHKNTGLTDAHNGAVYCVLGNSGKTSSVDSEWPHPVMYSYSASEVGAVILEVNGNRLDATFHTGANVVSDHFSIVKTETQHTEVEVCINDEVTLEPGWPVDGLSIWNPGNFYAQNYTIQPISNGTVIRSDAMGCIPDTFDIVVLQNDSCGYLKMPELNEISSYNAYWSKTSLVIEQDELRFTHFYVLDVQGRIVAEIDVTSTEARVALPALNQGLYYVRPQNNNEVKTIYREE